VVPTRNRADLLAKLLVSLRRQTLAPDRFEVVVVDDGSEDSTPDLLERERAESSVPFRVVRHSGEGPSAARNLGWRSAEAPLIAFTDDDCEATPTWLEALVQGARENPGAIVQGRTEIDPAAVDDVTPFSRTLEITGPGPYYATANILYPREVLERVDGFDEDFQRGEDTDLAWRARGAGAATTFAGDAVVHHAVVHLGPIGKLRWVLLWSSAVKAAARHPGVRESFTWRIFWKRSHALLALAVLGVLLARRMPPALLLCLPYARLLRARCLHEGYSLAYMPYLAVFDATELVAAARGGVQHRVFVL
jgi:glycosyltransferase involved in cell wall biosynthesis